MTQAQIYIYGIDLGKNWFHLVAMDRMGHVLTKQKLTRSQLKQFISTTPPRRVAFEACPGSQYWGRLNRPCHNHNGAAFTKSSMPRVIKGMLVA
ncbi:hypothetical protein ACE1BL_04370 [Aeromonas allosaccharophila]|uniref:hypothetical protein n=1 Tax=Aeromonas allosaccharophila TaxID=656 RepID=UPI0035B71586